MAVSRPCGEGQLGDAIPDGWWYGFLETADDGLVAIDVYCVYYDESAQPFFEECMATAYDETDCNHGITSFWPVNNSDRLRWVLASPTLVIEPEAGCHPMGTGSAVVHIVDGVLEYGRLECAHD